MAPRDRAAADVSALQVVPPEDGPLPAGPGAVVPSSPMSPHHPIKSTMSPQARIQARAATASSSPKQGQGGNLANMQHALAHMQHEIEHEHAREQAYLDSRSCLCCKRTWPARRLASAVARTRTFDLLIMLCICLNTAVMVMQKPPPLQDTAGNANDRVLSYLDNACSAMFLLEICVKVLAWGLWGVLEPASLFRKRKKAAAEAKAAEAKAETAAAPERANGAAGRQSIRKRKSTYGGSGSATDLAPSASSSSILMTEEANGGGGGGGGGGVPAPSSHGGPEHAYLVDPWNRLDFFVSLSSVPALVAFSLSTTVPINGTQAFRALRFLRPLKGIRFFQGIQDIIDSLVNSMTVLKDVLFFLVIMVVTFALFAVEYFPDSFDKRCVVNATGEQTLPVSFCSFAPEAQASSAASGKASYSASGWHCGAPWSGHACQAGYEPPNRGATSFDDMPGSLLITIQVMSLADWFYFMYILEGSTSWLTFAFFLASIALLSFLLLNLSVAVIAATFSQIRRKQKAVKAEAALLAAAAAAGAAAAAAAAAASNKSRHPGIVEVDGDTAAAAAAAGTGGDGGGGGGAGDGGGEAALAIANGDSLEGGGGGGVESNVDIASASTLKDRRTKRALQRKATQQRDVARQKSHAVVRAKAKRKAAGYQDDDDGESGLGGESPNSGSGSGSTWGGGNDVDGSDSNKKCCCGCCDAILGAVDYVVTHRRFDSLIMLFVSLNTAQMASSHHGQPAWLDAYFKVLESFFTWAFLSEMVLKIVNKRGPLRYLRDHMNKFDAVITLFSVYSEVGAGDSNISALRVFRLARVLRVTRLLRQNKKIRMLLDAALGSVTPLINLMVFIIFVLVTFGLLGMQLFGGYFNNCVSPDGDPLGHPRAHFDNFMSSLTTLFQIMTSDTWYIVMYHAMRAQTKNGQLVPSRFLAVPFFLGFFILSAYVLLNLFVAIILENFEEDEATILAAQSEQAELTAEKAEASRVSILKDRILGRRRLQEAVMAGRDTSTMDEEGTAVLPLPCCLAPGEEEEIHCCCSCCCLRLRFISAISDREPPPPLPQAKRGGDNAASEEDGGDDDDCNVSVTGVHIPLNPNPHARIRHAFRDRSLMCFDPQTSSVRQWAMAVVKHRYFERVILSAIVLSSLILCFDSRQTREQNPWFPLFLNVADLIFLSLFLIEFLLKVVAQGFLLTPRSYLSDKWNWLDFLVVVTGCITLAVKSSKLGWLRVIRMARTLRPLRLINRNKDMKIIIDSVLDSVPSVFNVFVLALGFLTIFSILALELFMGRLYFCNDGAATILTKDDCLGTFFAEVSPPSTLRTSEAPPGALLNPKGGLNPAFGPAGVVTPRVWANPVFNFDQFFWAIFTLFQVCTLDSWSVVMYACSDIVGVDMQPQRGASPENALFFLFFIFVGSLFVLQLFIGVTVDSYNRNAQPVLLTQQQQQWADVKTTINSLRCIKMPKCPPEPVPGKDGTPVGTMASYWHSWRVFCFDVAVDCNCGSETRCKRVFKRRWHSIHSRFDTVVLVCILLNMVIMCTKFKGQPDYWSDDVSNPGVLWYAGIVFAFIFFVECIVKMSGLGLARYFVDPWNRFDFSVVVLSTVFSFPWGGGQAVDSISAIARILRIMRIARVFRKHAGLYTILSTLASSFWQLVNISALLFMVMYVFAIMGTELFADLRWGYYINADANFDSFSSSILLLWRVLTFNWVGLMWDAWAFDFETECTYLDSDTRTDCGSILAPLYFISFLIIATLMMLNVLLAIIIENFQLMYSLQACPINHQSLLRYNRVWQMYDADANGYIAVADLRSFLVDLASPLGVPPVTATRPLASSDGSPEDKEDQHDEWMRQQRLALTVYYSIKANVRTQGVVVQGKGLPYRGLAIMLSSWVLGGVCMLGDTRAKFERLWDRAEDMTDEMLAVDTISAFLRTGARWFRVKRLGAKERLDLAQGGTLGGGSPEGGLQIDASSFAGDEGMYVSPGDRYGSA